MSDRSKLIPRLIGLGILILTESLFALSRKSYDASAERSSQAGVSETREAAEDRIPDGACKRRMRCAPNLRRRPWGVSYRGLTKSSLCPKCRGAPRWNRGDILGCGLTVAAGANLLDLVPSWRAAGTFDTRTTLAPTTWWEKEGEGECTRTMTSTGTAMSTNPACTEIARART